MAKTIRCQKCRVQIPSEAKHCPNCGAPVKRKHVALAAVLCVIVVIVAIILIASVINGDSPAPAGSPDPASKSPGPHTAAPSPTASQAEKAIAENDLMSVSFERIYEAASVEGVFYLQLEMVNKSEGEIWVYIENAYVNDESVPLVMAGVPTYIKPGKSSSNPFIFSYSALSIDAVSDVQTLEFDLVVADRESLNEIGRISGIRLTP